MAFRVFRCPECGENISVRFLKPGEIAECKACGEEVIVTESDPSGELTVGELPQPEVRRGVGPLLRALPALLITIGVIYTLGMFAALILSAQDRDGGILVVAAVLAGGILWISVLFGLAQAVRLLLRIEARLDRADDLRDGASTSSSDS